MEASMSTQTLSTQLNRRRAFRGLFNFSGFMLGAGLLVALLIMTRPGLSQNPGQPVEAESNAGVAVPRLIKFSGMLNDGRGYPITEPIEVTFSLYGQSAPTGEDGAETALWRETQRVVPSEKGAFTIYLGAASAGLPTEVFASAAAQWLGVKAAGEPEQARVLLVSVPYALKAGDATTLGGLPVSAFALAGAKSGLSAVPAALSPEVVPAGTDVTTTGGTAGYIPEFSGTSTIIDSPVFVSSGRVGIGTLAPTATLDVVGSTLFQGQASLATPGIATATAGTNSEPLVFYASSYSALNKAGITQKFVWQAEAAGNGSFFPSGTLNLLTGAGSSAPAQTGFYFDRSGLLHFAAGQTFPGTIAGVTPGTGLTGGGTTGTVTLNIDTTKLPLLAGNNTFAGNQIVNGSEIVSGGVESPNFALPQTSNPSQGALNIGGVAFLHGYGPGSNNVFVGGAGNFTTAGTSTTAVGFQALKAQAGGFSNTALGLNSLIADTGGSQNTAIGAGALYTNVTGSNNTAIGTDSGAYNGSGLSNTTAVGANALVSQNNSLVLGNTSSAPGAEFVNVGIGTASPISALEASVQAAGALGPVLTLTNPAGDTSKAYGAAAIDFNTQPILNVGYNPGARIEAIDDGLNSDSILFLFNKTTAKNSGLISALTIGKNYITIADGLGFDVGDVNSIVNSGSSFNQFGNGITTAGGQNANNSGNGGPGIVSYGGSNGLGGAGGVFQGGLASTGGDGIHGIAGIGTTDGYAGVFQGDVTVTGSIVASSKNFKIDHPLDPANKYLYHASVESSEMMNIYSGNVVTDELGLATVTLPDWFESLNTDFRYQLTAIGQDAHAWVAQEVSNKQFKISTNPAHVKVSWQITAVRQDAFAKAHPMVVEQAKSERERGFYIHPELYGQPEERQTEWARHPEMMQRLKTHREAMRPGARAVEKKDGLPPQTGAGASAVDRPVPAVVSRIGTKAQPARASQVR
jgi:hypothetical protein